MKKIRKFDTVRIDEIPKAVKKSLTLRVRPGAIGQAFPLKSGKIKVLVRWADNEENLVLNRNEITFIGRENDGFSKNLDDAKAPTIQCGRMRQNSRRKE